MSGATRWQTFWRITLALMLPVTTSAFILSFIRGMESFELAVFFGTPVGINVITTTIYNSITQRAQPDYQSATALGFAAMALMFLLLILQGRLLRGRSFTTVTGKGYSPNVMRLGAMRWVTFAVCIAFFILTVVLPIGQLLLSSFFQFFGFYQLDMLTLDHYRDVFGNRAFWNAFANTMLLGVTGATATMVLGGIVAYVTTRTRWRGRRLIDVLAWLPWMMPGMVLGIGFLWGFATLPHAIPIYGTLWALLLAYMALGTPVAVRVASGAYQQIATDIEECSRVHGAGWWQTLFRILVALAWPAFAVGWVLIFFGIMRELSASILLYAPNTEVLSVVMLKMWSGGKPEEVSVIGLLMLVLVLLFRWVQLRFIKRRYQHALREGKRRRCSGRFSRRLRSSSPWRRLRPPRATPNGSRWSTPPRRKASWSSTRRPWARPTTRRSSRHSRPNTASASNCSTRAPRARRTRAHRADGRPLRRRRPSQRQHGRRG